MFVLLLVGVSLCVLLLFALLLFVLLFVFLLLIIVIKAEAEQACERCAGTRQTIRASEVLAAIRRGDKP